MNGHRFNATKRGRVEVLEDRCMLATTADFNADGLWDTQDLNALTMAISSGQFDPQFDLDGDGAVAAADLNSWLAIGAMANGRVDAYLSGDTNLDGRVDARDLNALALNWQANTAQWSNGNFVVDSRIDSSDLNALATNWLREVPTISETSGPLFPAQKYELGDTFDYISTGESTMVAADFDGDGFVDLAVGTEYRSETVIVVLLGRGDGTLTDDRRTSVFPLGSGVSDMDIGDFNGDGVVDLAIASYRDGQSVLLGRGDGTFHLATTFRDGGRSCCESVDTRDINGDGLNDLLSPSSGLTIRHGRGDGTFSAPRVIDLPGPLLAVADFDDDGNFDLVTLAPDAIESVMIFRGKEDESFAEGEVVWQSPTGVNSVTFGNFNADDILDLATIRQTLGGSQQNGITVLLGVGDGTFQAQPPQIVSGEFPIVGVFGTVDVFTTVDVNADGITDLTAIDQSENKISVLLGAGDGSFEHAQYRTGDTRAEALAHTWGDFDGDGFVDAASLINEPRFDSTSNIVILIGEGDGSLVAAAETPWGLHRPSSSYIVEDLDKDGFLDITVPDQDAVLFFFGQGDGLFDAQRTLSIGHQLNSMVDADFNHDGLADLLLAHGESNDVSILLNLGDRQFAQQNVDVGADSFSSIAPGDVNGDGSVDLIISTIDGQLKVMLGQDDGTFVEVSRIPLAGPAYSIGTADFNNDSILDLVTATAGTEFAPAQIDVLLGLGDGTFLSQPRLDNGRDPTMLVTADFNGDGLVDLVTPDRSGAMVVRLGLGDGTFETEMTMDFAELTPELPGLGVGSLFAFADFNSDNVLDVAITSRYSAQVSVLFGFGNGRFGQPRSFAVDNSGLNFMLVAGDFDGNGTVDLAMNNDRINVLLNQSEVPAMGNGVGDGHSMRPFRACRGDRHLSS